MTCEEWLRDNTEVKGASQREIHAWSFPDYISLETREQIAFCSIAPGNVRRKVVWPAAAGSMS